MNKKIYPCLWLNGQAAEAARFYTGIFANSQITSQSPMVVHFEVGGLRLMALNGGPQFSINQSVSILAELESSTEVERIWEALMQGAQKVFFELQSYPWSQCYGWLQDQYGLTWQLMLGAKSYIRPSLMFAGGNFGKAEEAICFYTQIFENSAVNTLQKYGSEVPFEGKVMFADFHISGFGLSGMDGPGEHHFTFSEGLSVVVNCDNQAEIDYYWSVLTTDGAEGNCGWCQDRYGLWWQVVPSILPSLMAQPATAARVAKAFMKMKKFDIDALLLAVEG
jgi:predicted 3-demethylubiquinone-9 3-methyltransferase (glyoxalase superfamily)